MKKTFVLAALAATLAAPAFAQSSVTIYGRLNMTVERSKFGNADAKTDINDVASRLGFKGVEDLGGGLKAGFQIEHRFDASTGVASAPFWAGQSELNLSGSFGMIRLGSFTSEAYFATADYVSLHNHDTGFSSDGLYADANFFNQVNKAAYRTPEMGGFWAELAVLESDGVGERGYDLAANYTAGDLHVGFGYSKLDSINQFALSALYTMGNFTFGGYIQRDKNTFAVINPAYDGNRTNFRLSGMYTMGATELHANLGMAGDVGGVKDSGATQLTLGINQNLSKRTKVYGYYSKVSADNAAPYIDRSHLALGVRHNF